MFAAARIVLLSCVLAEIPGGTSALADPPIPDMSGRAMTVMGPVLPADLGVTLPHEHLFMDFTLPLDSPARWSAAGRRYPSSEQDRTLWEQPITMGQLGHLIRNVWNNRDVLLLQNSDLLLAEVQAFKEAGGSTIVDVTSIGLGRSPVRLVELARRSGLRIVMGAGWYRSAWHPAGHAERSVDSLTQEIVRDLTVGVGDTGIRAGIIGEVSAMEVVTEPADSAEVKGIRAAARASRLTGAAISVHQWVRDGVALRRTLDILEAEGADLSRVVIGHIDAVATQNLPRLEAVLDRGATLEFDLFGTPYYLADPRLDHRPMADAIVALVQRGYGDRLLLSHDICTKLQLKAYGGRGFDYVLTEVVPYLQKQGLTEAQVRQLTVDNPRRLLTFASPVAP